MEALYHPLPLELMEAHYLPLLESLSFLPCKADTEVLLPTEAVILLMEAVNPLMKAAILLMEAVNPLVEAAILLALLMNSQCKADTEVLLPTEADTHPTEVANLLVEVAILLLPLEADILPVEAATHPQEALLPAPPLESITPSRQVLILKSEYHFE